MRKILLLPVVAALVAAACTPGDPVVARVDGQAILLSQIESLRITDGEATVPREDFSVDLRNVIAETALVSGADRDFGIAITPEEVDASYEALVAEVEAQGIPIDVFLEQQGLTVAVVEQVALQRVLFTELGEHFRADIPATTTEEVEVAYEQTLQQIATVCAHHILLETEEEARRVLRRLDEGEDFEEVAVEVSVDPSAQTNSGNLDCNPPGGFVAEFADALMEAPVGELHGPVESSFGFHVVRVDSREVPSLEEQRPAIEQQLQDNLLNDLIGDWVLETLRVAEVEIDPKYGTWETDPQPQVVPPQG